jgi:hypothetical protein
MMTLRIVLCAAKSYVACVVSSTDDGGVEVLGCLMLDVGACAGVCLACAGVCLCVRVRAHYMRTHMRVCCVLQDILRELLQEDIVDAAAPIANFAGVSDCCLC